MALRPNAVMASSFLRFLDHTQRRTTVGRTPLDEWSARRRDLYLTTHNTHNRQISMPPVGFEPTIWVGERPQTYALDRAATGTGLATKLSCLNSNRTTLTEVWQIFYLFCLNSWFRASWFNVNKKVQLDATICRHLFTAKSLYMFRGVTAPIIRSTKNCNRYLWYRS